MQYYFQMGPVVFDKMILKVSQYIHREKWHSPLVAMFINRSIIYEQSWKRVTQGPFVANYFQMGPVAFDKKIF